jgi:hypothetical protein
MVIEKKGVIEEKDEITSFQPHQADSTTDIQDTCLGTTRG